MKPRLEMIDLGECQISTATWGTGTPQIVLLHDGLGSISQWRTVPGNIATRLDCAVLAYDRAGHGSSLPTPTTVRPASWLHSEANILEALLGALHIENPILVGHSDGATIALIYGARNASTRCVVAIAAHSWVEQVAVDRINGMQANPEPVVEGLARHHSNPLALFDSWSQTWASAPFQSWDVRTELHTLTAPTLIVQGSQDEFASEEQIFATAAAIGSNAEPVLLPGQPHLIHHDNPEVVVDVVANFVERREYLWMSTVETFGFAAGTTVAVVHADDIGMSHSANVGAFEALANGPATSGSVMVPCPWFSEAATWAQDGRDIDLGVHLTLNAEYEGLRWGPTAGRTSVPSLLDESGYLYATSRETIKYGSVDDVATELRAQIDVALRAGIDVTHLDSHMGTVFHPKFFDIYLALGREYRLPLFLPRGADGEAPDNTAGLTVFDGYCVDSLDFEPGDGQSHNERRLRDLAPGLNYLVCHPAKDGDELSAITSTAHNREFERTFYGGESGRQALADANIQTIGMRPLRDLLRTNHSG